MFPEMMCWDKVAIEKISVSFQPLWEKWYYKVPYGAQQHKSYVHQSCRPWGAPYVGHVDPCVVALVTTVGMLAGMTGFQPNWLQAPT